MTRFHTDEYIHFLSRVTPENFRQLTFDGTRCEWFRTFWFMLSGQRDGGNSVRSMRLNESQVSRSGICGIFQPRSSVEGPLIVM